MISGASEQELELATVIADKLLLQKENQELKKQVEISKMANDKNVDIACELIIKYKNQQKEFILYLRHLSNWYSADGVKQGMVNEILQKYKSIIGDKQ